MARTGGCYYGWNIIALVVIIQMFTNGLAINCLTFLSPLVQSMGFTLAQSALMISVMSIAGLVGKASCGLLADGFGNRLPWILIGLISASSVALLSVTR